MILEAFARLQAQRARGDADRGGIRERGGATAATGSPRAFGSLDESTRSRCRSLYAEADIFLNASVVDNQPVSILEAFAAGLPVVSTPTGDIAAMVRHGQTGLLVPPNDPAALAAAVLRLIERPREALDMARQHGARCAGTRGRRCATSGHAVYAGARATRHTPHESARSTKMALVALSHSSTLKSGSRTMPWWRSRNAAGRKHSKRIERLAPHSMAESDPRSWLQYRGPALANPACRARRSGKASRPLLRRRCPSPAPHQCSTACPEGAARSRGGGGRCSSSDASICWDTGRCRSAIPSTGISIRSGRGARRSRTGAVLIRSIRRSSATARSSGSSTGINGSCRLAQAWVFTRDERYAAACVTSIDAWHRGQPGRLSASTGRAASKWRTV